MNLLTEILTFVGFIAFTFGAAGTISKFLKAAEERKRIAAQNHQDVIAALKRIDETLSKLKP